MVLCLVQHIATSSAILQAAQQLAVRFKKQFGVLMLNVKAVDIDREQAYLEKYLQQENISYDYLAVSNNQLSEIQSVCDELEVSILTFQLSKYNRATIMPYLKACRGLRIPYVFLRDDIASFPFEKLLMPVSFLVEEVEKAQFAAAFGRHFESELCILQAKDYGSKAAENIAKITAILDKFDLQYEVVKGKKDSFKIDFDALHYAKDKFYDLLLITASREYGLDDVVFGPKELHLLRKTKSALMFVNPRADLYVLCD